MHPDTRSLACFVQPGMEGEKVYLKIYPPKKEAQVMFVWICQAEDKQRASQQFFKLQAAMKVLGISSDEQRALWLILGAIYHLGAAGTTKGKIAWMHSCTTASPIGDDVCSAVIEQAPVTKQNAVFDLCTQWKIIMVKLPLLAQIVFVTLCNLTDIKVALSHCWQHVLCDAITCNHNDWIIHLFIC